MLATVLLTALEKRKKQEKCKHSSTDKWLNQCVNHPAATLKSPIKETVVLYKGTITYIKFKRRFIATVEPSHFFEK